MTTDARTFLKEQVAALRPLFVETRRSYWAAHTRNSPDVNRQAAEAEIRERSFYADPERLATVKRFLEDETLDPIVRRQLDQLHRSCLRNAFSQETIEDLVARGRQIEECFINFRSTVDGQPVSNNDILDILSDSTDERLRWEAWNGSKEIGEKIAAPLRELARKRNEAARGLGFSDFYSMELELQEIPEETLSSICTQLKTLSEEPFLREKRKIDGEIAERLGISPDAVRAHHYSDPFFQQSPKVSDVMERLDDLFRDRDVVQLSRSYFRGVGLPVEEILEMSDLYEREGKDQHAFCMHLDREGDVRVLCNVKPTERWAETMLHELGHAVYDVCVPRELPFLLRQPVHIFATESVAQFFGRLTRNSGWLQAMLGIDADTATTLDRDLPAERRRSMLIFVRWTSVMIEFERELYRDPDRPDLNRLWWEIVGEYQKIPPPDDVDDRHDWATKIHLAVAPVYYHNYLLGELMASQLGQAIDRSVGGGERGYTEDHQVGEFFRDRVFSAGSSLPWPELVRSATGEDLGPDAFIREFVTEAS